MSGIEDNIIEYEYIINGNTYKEEGLEPETEYKVQIKAYNSKSQSYISKEEVLKRQAKHI